MGYTQGRRQNRFRSWPTPQNASSISSIPRAYSLSQAAQPLIQRNSRRLSTPLYHCFTWEEMRTWRREFIEKFETSSSSTSSLSSFPLPPLHPYTHPLVEFNNGGFIDIEFRSMYSTKFFRRAEKILLFNVDLIVQLNQFNIFRSYFLNLSRPN